MVAGSVTRAMVMFGDLMCQVSDRIIAMGTGFIPVMGGPGYPAIVGDGHHFTMAAG